MILIQRVIRSKGSKVAVTVGKVREIRSLEALRFLTRKRKQVFCYLTETGEGVMRSGRKMRPVDMNVRNVRETIQQTF